MINDLKQIKQLASEFAQAYKQSLVADNKVASGSLTKNIKSRVKYDGKWLEIILSLEYYWKYVEYGRKPGKFPPIDKIRNWILIKPILPRPLSNGKLPTTNQLAYLISRKIATKGIKPTYALRDSITKFDLVGRLTTIIGNEIQKQILEN